MYELNIIHQIPSQSNTWKCFLYFHKIHKRVIAIIIGYTTIAIAGNGIPKIQANGNENKLLQESVSLTSQNKDEVSQAL